MGKHSKDNELKDARKALADLPRRETDKSDRWHDANSRVIEAESKVPWHKR